MTAAQTLTEEDADWAIAWRLINWQPAGPRPATDAELRLAAWLMLDRDMTHAEIIERTGLTRGRVAGIAELRELAGDAEEGEEARQLAPTAEQRARIGIRRGITRPELPALRRRRLQSVS